MSEKPEIFSVVLNGKETFFASHIDVMQLVFSIITRHKYAPINSLKENIREAVSMLDEWYDFRIERKSGTEKSTLTKAKNRLNRLLDYTDRQKDRDKLIYMVYNFMLSLEGKNTLGGFQYTSKVFRDIPRGNAETQSILTPR